MKTHRTEIQDLTETHFSELSDEHLAQACGGGLAFGTTSYTQSWNCMDVDKPIYTMEPSDP